MNEAHDHDDIDDEITAAGQCDVWHREGVLLMDSEEPERGVVRRHERGGRPRGSGVRGHSVGR